MRVCFFGTFDRNYSRNQILQRCFADLGHESLICHSELWPKSQDKEAQSRSFMTLLGFVVRLLWVYGCLVWKYIRLPRHDLVVVSFPGHFDAPLAIVLARVYGRRVLYDPLISLYDTTVDHRQLFTKHSLLGQVAWCIDHFNACAADLVLVDTDQHREYFSSELRVPRQRLFVLPVGANEQIYAPAENKPSCQSVRLFHYSRTTRIHGLELILAVLKELQARSIAVEARIVGSGALYERLRQKYQGLLNNTTFFASQPEEQLALEIQRADLCFGLFGAGAKASRVVPNKIYQALACGTAVMTQPSPAIKSHLGSCPAIILVDSDLRDLVRFIEEHQNRKRYFWELGEAGRKHFERQFSRQKLAALLGEILRCGNLTSRR